MNKPLKSKRPTIGLMIGYFDRLHEDEIWQGINEVASEADVNLITFIGRHLQSPHGFDSQANIVYALPDPHNVDGLLITTTIISTFINDAEIRAFLQQYQHIPVVNIGRTHIPGTTSVYTGTKSGVNTLLDHLFAVHQYQRVAFIGGPTTAASARSRYNAYTEKLKENGILLDETLVVAGDYSLESGREAITTLIDERGATFDALFAANDDMALGAMETLQARGIRVPDEIAVVGVDDKHYARIANPPLTSIGIDFVAQGRQAARLLLRKIAGESVADEFNLPATSLIIRQSCGCFEAPATLAIPADRPAKADRAAQLSTLKKQQIRDSISAEQIEQIWDAFWHDDGPNEKHFLVTLRRLLQDTVAAEQPPSDWHQLIMRMRRVLYFNESDQQLSVENLWQQAHVLISATARQALAHRHWQTTIKMQTLQEIAQRLITTFDLDEFAAVIQSELPRLDIQGCFVVLFEPDTTVTARMVAAYTTDGQTIRPADRLTFPTRDLVPPELIVGDERQNLVVEPLYFQNEQLGFVIFQAATTVSGAIFEALRSYISSALKGALLLQQTTMKASELEDQVEVRTAELMRERNTLRTLVDSIPDQICLKDREHRFVLVNEALALAFGEDVIGKTDREVALSLNHEAMYQEEARIFATGEPLLNEETEVPTALVMAGQPAWTLRNKIPVLDVTGKITGLLCINRDIALQKEAERRLQDERNLLRTLIDNLPDHIYMKDQDHRFLLVNRALTDAWDGLDLIGKTDAELIPGPHAAEHSREEEHLFETGQPVLGAELHVPVHPDSPHDAEWFAVTKIPLLGQDGKVNGLVGINRDITEQKRAEIRIKEERTLLRTLIDHMPDRIFVKDNDRRFILVNDALQAQHTTNLIGKRDEDIYPTNADQHRQEEEAILSDGKRIIDQEMFLINDDGAPYWLQKTKVPLRNQHQEIIGLVGIVRDIRQFKQIQFDLEAERNLLHTMIDNIPDHIYLKDAEHRFILANRALREIWQRDLIGKSDRDLFPAERANRFIQEEKSIMDSGEAIINQESHSPPDVGARNHDEWIVRTKIPLYDHTGQTTGILGINRDVTAQKMAERRLEAERTLLRTLIDHLPLEVYAKDLESRFILANRATLKYTEYDTMEAIMGTSDLDSRVFDGMLDLAQQHYESEQEMMRTGKPIVDLITPPINSPHKNAGDRWVITNKVPLRDGDGNIIGLVGINQDITERKEQEAEREQLIAELEARHAEMERFTYTVSHDLRSPLITIKGFIGLLENDVANQDAARIASDLSYIRTAAEQMEHLLNDLLELSRIGRIMNSEEAIELNELVGDAVKIVMGQIMQNDVKVTVQSGLPVIQGDRARLVEVFQNLLENAIKYMGKQPHPQIEIGAEPRDYDVLCFVRDNGMGIVSDYHETIFKLFDQLDPDVEGTGIGLALVRRIIDYHNGSIWVESDGPGKGSTFYFTLPLPT